MWRQMGNIIFDLDKKTVVCELVEPQTGEKLDVFSPDWDVAMRYGQVITIAPDVLEVLDGLLDKILANRGTEHEFVRNDVMEMYDPVLVAARRLVERGKV